MIDLDFAPLGDSALVVRVGTRIDESTRLQVRRATLALASIDRAIARDVVPGYTTVTVHYDPATISWELLSSKVAAALAQPIDASGSDDRLVAIPVCYGGEFGPDLEAVATRAALDVQQVIDLHVAPEYRVHLLGFLPGFGYLGGLDPRIAAPRRSTPRDRVPVGSVGIAGLQTGVYPLESPGGWQLIGRSPVTLFDPSRTPPTLLTPGDRVRFVPIDRAEFDRAFAGVP